MRTGLWVVAGMLAVGGCAGAADHGSAEMSAALSSAQTETSQHAQLCAGAATMSDVIAELQRHDQAMAPILDRVDNAMGDMHGMHGMHCSGSEMEPMMGSVSSMRAALHDHDTWLGSAADLDHAHAECARYKSDMLGLCNSAEHDNETMSCM